MQIHVQAEKMDFDPARADYVENRLDEIKSLKRKYGNSVEDVLRYCEDAKKEIDQLSRQEKDSGALDNVVRICNGLDTSIGTMQSAYMDGGLENNVTDLSEREKKLVLNYRAAGVLQEAIDKLLDLK